MMYYEGPNSTLASTNMPEGEVFIEIEKKPGLGFTEKVKYVKK